MGKNAVEFGTIDSDGIKDAQKSNKNCVILYSNFANSVTF